MLSVAAKFIERRKSMSFEFREIQEYLSQCEINGWEPTWEGAEAFQRIRDKRHRWMGVLEERNA